MSTQSNTNSNINFIDGQTEKTELLATVAFFQGKQGQFYVVKKSSDEKGYKYTSHFPVQWALNHLQYTGPEECDCCRKQGTINGVFAFYCCNCQQEYEYARGGSGEKLYFGYDISQEDLWSEFNYLKGVKFSEIGDEELGQNNNEPWHIDVQWAPSGEKIKSRFSPISATHRTDVEVETEYQDYESEYPEYEEDPEEDPRFTGIAHANSWTINQDERREAEAEAEAEAEEQDPRFTGRVHSNSWFINQDERREAALQAFEEIANGDQHEEQEQEQEQEKYKNSEERVNRERMELERLQQECRDDMDDRLLGLLGY